MAEARADTALALYKKLRADTALALVIVGVNTSLNHFFVCLSSVAGTFSSAQS